MKRNLSASKYEQASSFAVVEADMSTAPFSHLLGLHPNDLASGKKIRAFSRAKVYFRGWLENIRNRRYQIPNMNYPFWGAKLAGLSDHSLINAVIWAERGWTYHSQPVEY